jgi:hypothetical protein
MSRDARSSRTTDDLASKEETVTGISIKSVIAVGWTEAAIVMKWGGILYPNLAWDSISGYPSKAP